MAIYASGRVCVAQEAIIIWVSHAVAVDAPASRVRWDDVRIHPQGRSQGRIGWAVFHGYVG